MRARASGIPGSTLFRSTRQVRPEEIRWDGLSPLAMATLRQIATPRSVGYSLSEIAKKLEIQPSFARQLLDELATEIKKNASGTQDEIEPVGEPPS